MTFLLGTCCLLIIIFAFHSYANPNGNPTVKDQIESLVTNNARYADVPLMRKIASPAVTAGDNIMFWRLQKVGSSTLLSLLMSYAYRYDSLPRRKATANSFCKVIAKCAYQADPEHKELRIYATLRSSQLAAEVLAQSIPFKISLTHEICNLNSSIVRDHLRCAFHLDQIPTARTEVGKQVLSGEVKEIFMVRDPLSRLISIYYFWGELFKMQEALRAASKSKSLPSESSSSTLRHGGVQKHPRGVLGGASGNRTVMGPLFLYHGSEETVPPLDIARAFAFRFPLRRGFPGPSLSHSAFASNIDDALAYMNSSNLFTIVLERLDESLVVLRHFLGWSLADVVVTKTRKALSVHPKASHWPNEVVQLMQVKLDHAHEYSVYNIATRQLNEKRLALESRGVNVSAEVFLLKRLQAHVLPLCLNESHLNIYKESMVGRGLLPHPSQNKLRDVEDRYVEGGHVFSFNGEILGSFDVCGSCEAHALLTRWVEESRKVDYSRTNTENNYAVLLAAQTGMRPSKHCPSRENRLVSYQAN
eukprot:gene8786-9688_t